MAWSDRIRESITLVSPKGTSFEAKWIGNTRTADKLVGLRVYPKFIGTIVQDLGWSGDRWPLSVYFDGDDNDIMAEDFARTLKETGNWTITHPTKGVLTLSLLSFTENIQPITDGGYTKFDLEFIEPADESLLSSPVELSSAISNQKDLLNQNASSQFANNIKTGKTSEVLANKNTIEKIVSSCDKNLNVMTAKSATITNQIVSIKRGITQTLQSTVLDTVALAGQIKNIIQLPMMAVTDIRARIDSYTNLVTDLLGITPSGNTTEDFNVVNANELALVSVLAALGESVGSGTIFKTKAQALQTIDDLNALLFLITNSLDEIQTDFSDQYLNNQYFSQTESFTDACKLIAQSTEYLLSASLNLKVEKRITLEKAENPLAVSIREYGSTSETAESDFDLFIDSNNLDDTEILLLPAGREVVVYV